LKNIILVILVQVIAEDVVTCFFWNTVYNRLVRILMMVSVGVSCLGCTDVHFLEPGVNVNAEYCRDVILKQMLPDIKRTFLVTTALFSSRTAHQHIEQR